MNDGKNPLFADFLFFSFLKRDVGDVVPYRFVHSHGVFVGRTACLRRILLKNAPFWSKFLIISLTTARGFDIIDLQYFYQRKNR